MKINNKELAEKNMEKAKQDRKKGIYEPSKKQSLLYSGS